MLGDDFEKINGLRPIALTKNLLIKEDLQFPNLHCAVPTINYNSGKEEDESNLKARLSQASIYIELQR